MKAETIESLAVLAEKTGVAIAALIRQDPEFAETVGFAQFLSVAKMFSTAMEIHPACRRELVTYELVDALREARRCLRESTAEKRGTSDGSGQHDDD